MKLKYLVLGIASAALLVSCGGNSTPDTPAQDTTATTTTEPEVPATEEVSGEKVAIDTEASVVTWYGSKKIVEGEHSGTVSIKEGNFIVEEGALVGGSAVIDMSTIGTEEYSDDAETKAKLIGHLKNGDFFDVEKYPTSKFVVTSVTDGEVTGDLTIKDVTEQISFPAEIAISEEGIALTASFSIDRTKFNVKYGSDQFFTDLLDKFVIEESIEFTLDLKSIK